MTHEHLKPDEIAMLERAEKATKGPYIDYATSVASYVRSRGTPLTSAEFHGPHPQNEHDAELYCRSRTDLPTILTRLANERAKLAIAMEALERFTAFEPLADAALCRINELEKQS